MCDQDQALADQSEAKQAMSEPPAEDSIECVDQFDKGKPVQPVRRAGEEWGV